MRAEDEDEEEEEDDDEMVMVDAKLKTPAKLVAKKVRLRVTLCRPNS